MANPMAGVYYGFVPEGVILRTRMYAVNTAPTINVSVGDLVGLEPSFIDTPKLGAAPWIQDGAVLSTTPGDEFLIAGAVLACFDSAMDPLQYIPAALAGDGTCAGYILVADDPNQQFHANVNGVLVLANMDLLYLQEGEALYAPNTYTKLSTMRITSAGAANTATFPLRLVTQKYPGQDSYALTGCRMICSIMPICHAYGTVAL